MTVIEFGKRDLKINSLIVIMIAVLIISAVLGVFLYIRLISLRHDISNNEDALAKLRVQTAEMGNRLNKLLDGAYDAAFVQASGFVIDKNPSYSSPLRVVSQATN
jgi:cell division protein FtsB